MSIEKPQDFVLKSVELKAGGKTKITWMDDQKEHSIVSNVPPHPDFVKHQRSLVTKLVQYLDGKAHMEDDITFKKVSLNLYEDMEGQSVQIKGVHTHPKSAQNSTLTTSKIQTHESHYGFEGNLKTVVEGLTDEACDYIFEGKSSQTKMEFELQDAN